MREITDLIIHESDTPTGRPTLVEDIDEWHRERGWKRDEVAREAFNPTLTSIGYHYVIYIDGSVHTGRSVEEVGAHCKGHNAHSIGICLVGKGTYNESQWEALENLVRNLEHTYGNLVVKGHCEYDTAISQGKTCPDFDVQAWISNDFLPLA